MSYVPRERRHARAPGFLAGGFTFIELLMYIAVVGILLTMVISLFFALARARTKAQSVVEVEQQGYTAMTLMTQTIRNAQGIIAPSPGATSSTTALSTYTASTSPTLFSLASSTLYSTEGSSSPIALTNTQVAVSNLSFQNLAASSTHGSIKIQFTLSHASSSRSETNYSATFFGSASVRNQQ